MNEGEMEGRKEILKGGEMEGETEGRRDGRKEKRNFTI